MIINELPREVKINLLDKLTLHTILNLFKDGKTSIPIQYVTYKDMEDDIGYKTPELKEVTLRQDDLLELLSEQIQNLEDENAALKAKLYK